VWVTLTHSFPACTTEGVLVVSSSSPREISFIQHSHKVAEQGEMLCLGSKWSEPICYYTSKQNYHRFDWAWFYVCANTI